MSRETERKKRMLAHVKDKVVYRKYDGTNYRVIIKADSGEVVFQILHASENWNTLYRFESMKEYEEGPPIQKHLARILKMILAE